MGSLPDIPEHSLNERFLENGNLQYCSKTSKKVKLRDTDSPLQGTGQNVEEVNDGARDAYSEKRKIGGLETLPKTLKYSPMRGKTSSASKKKGAEVIKLKRKDILEEFEVIVPSFGLSNSGEGGVRDEVRYTLRLFHAICRKLLQGDETKMRLTGSTFNRIDILSSNMIKELDKQVHKGKQIIGPVPGVEVGDEYRYRAELALVGLHRSYQSGIDYIKHEDNIVATSIVSSGGYADDVDFGDVLKYTGQGGNVVSKKDKTKQPEDQKLERGNLALKNCISANIPVRVIRGYKEIKITNTRKSKVFTSYTYDGLYSVERYWQEKGLYGKLVYMFELKRRVGQPELALKEVRKMGKLREGICDKDISRGKEKYPISAINTVDEEKPPNFSYITKMKYPDWCSTTPPKGCDCVGGCYDSQSCSCVSENEDFPYNLDGAIVEVKPLVYECGPHCKCPPSCDNKVSQKGSNIQLEIFKTESRGWGVRSLASIPSGTFICEYLGELLNDEEAEARKGNDEYLFGIGQNYDDCPVGRTTSSDDDDDDDDDNESENDVSFVIDANENGNIGRFINHSCSPNLYPQNVLYDHEDKKMPHIMLFAYENIPPLQELTYHYYYEVNQIKDSDGNIKVKDCYCGSQACTGRMY